MNCLMQCLSSEPTTKINETNHNKEGAKETVAIYKLTIFAEPSISNHPTLEEAQDKCPLKGEWLHKISNKRWELVTDESTDCHDYVASIERVESDG